MTPPDLPDAAELLRELVSIDTTNPGGDENQAAQYLAELFEARGLQVDVDRYDEKHVNVTAIADFGPGPTIMLNSHLDVVPAGGAWASPPFTPRITDGRMYGRGATDAKGSLAPMAAAVLQLVSAPQHMRGRVVYTAVGDEEVGSSGARRLLTTWQPDGAIVGEPTDLRLLTAHKGSVRPVIELAGRSAHAATPQAGINAIEAVEPFMAALHGYAAELKGRTHNLVGSPTMTPVLIEGGEAPNAVPSSCRITIDRRLVPGETAEMALSEFDDLITTFNDEHAPYVARVATCAPSTGGPSETHHQDPFVIACQDGLRTVGQDSSLAGLMVNCDMTHFRAADVPTVVIGPGDLEAMHVVDESVRIDDVRQAVGVYEQIVRSCSVVL